MMLRHLDYFEIADKIERSCFETIASGTKTGDLGGKAKCSEFAEAICARLRNMD